MPRAAGSRTTSPWCGNPLDETSRAGAVLLGIVPREARPRTPSETSNEWIEEAFLFPRPRHPSAVEGGVRPRVGSRKARGCPAGSAWRRAVDPARRALSVGGSPPVEGAVASPAAAASSVPAAAPAIAPVREAPAPRPAPPGIDALRCGAGVRPPVPPLPPPLPPPRDPRSATGPPSSSGGPPRGRTPRPPGKRRLPGQRGGREPGRVRDGRRAPGCHGAHRLAMGAGTRRTRPWSCARCAPTWASAP